MLIKILSGLCLMLLFLKWENIFVKLLGESILSCLNLVICDLSLVILFRSLLRIL